MSDDLRTKIAAVIDREVDGLWEPLDVADAVIQELGLEREDGECLYCHAQLPFGRYVAWDKDADV